MLELLNRTIKVAIVGSRNASDWGKECVRLLVMEFGRQEVVIASGYAKGIDTEAHKGALEAEEGATIIVLPEGIMRFDPRSLENFTDWQKRTLVLPQFAPDDRLESTKCNDTQ